MEKFARKLVRNTCFNFLSKVAGFVGTLALSVITARMLGPNSFGSYSLVTATLTVAGLAANLGISSVAIKYTAEFSGDGGKASRAALFAYLVRFKLLATLAAIVALVALSSPFASFYDNPDLRLYVLVSAAGLLPSGFAMLFNNIITGLQEYKNIAKRTLIVAPLNVLLAFSVLRAGWGIMGLILSTVTVNIVEFLFYLAILRPRFTFSAAEKLPDETKKRIRRYNLQVFGIIFLDAIVWQRSEVFFLGRFRPADEVGYYSLAYGIIEKALVFLPSIISGVLMPAISELYGKNQREHIKKLYIASTRYLLMVAVPLSVGLVMFSSDVVALMFGREYMAVVPVLNILLISGVFGIAASAGSSVQYGTENQSFILKIGSLVAVGNILLDLVLIPRFGATGAAIANSAAQVAGVCAGTYQVARLLRVRFPFLELGRIVAAALTIIPVSFLVRRLLDGPVAMPVGIIAGMIVYLISLVFFKAVKLQDLRLLELIAAGKAKSEKQNGDILHGFKRLIVNYLRIRPAKVQ